MIRSPTLCVAGKNQIGVDVLQAALDYGRWAVVALPNLGDSGEDGRQPSLRRFAESRAVPVVDLAWAEAKPGLCFVSVEFDRLIRPNRFASDRLFNIHFSLLPKYRGCNTAIWPILNGETEHGVTLHWIDAGMDTGAIIDQRAFTIGESTARDLYFTCMVLGSALVREWLDRMVEGDDLPASAQDGSRATSYHRSDLDYSLAAIDPRCEVERVLQIIRAFHFPEYQRATWSGRPIARARRAESVDSKAPGTAVYIAPDLVRLWVADGAVDLSFAD